MPKFSVKGLLFIGHICPTVKIDSNRLNKKVTICIPPVIYLSSKQPWGRIFQSRFNKNVLKHMGVTNAYSGRGD